jgi:hypothetical protein
LAKNSINGCNTLSSHNLRKHLQNIAELEKCGSEARKKLEGATGVTGKSPLIEVDPDFDIIRGYSQDLLHQYIYGIMNHKTTRLSVFV